ncbi:MAG: exo-alpha-sialidase [Thermodesulfobacteriota bacterium]
MEDSASQGVVRPEPVQAQGEADPLFVENTVNPDQDIPVSHVSSLTRLRDGRIACVWYGGNREGAKDVKIYLSVYDEASRVWSKPRTVVSRETSSRELGRYVRKVGNPVIFNDPEGRLWLVYVSISIGGWSGSSLNYKVSYDNGGTWSPSRKLYLTPLFNLSNLVKNKPLFLNGGTILLPVYHELAYKFPELLLFKVSGDELSYVKRRMLFMPGLLQPSLISTGSRNIAAYFRNAREGAKNYVMKSVSPDNGRTWQAPVNTPLPNPNSGFDMVASPRGRTVIVLNDTFNDRYRLAVYASKDRGENWEKVIDLENARDREFSYPSIIRTPEGLYHVTYTYDRKHIKHVSFTDKWLDGNGP